MGEAKRLTEDELKDLFRTMREEWASAPATALESHISDLSAPTPEEVARDYEQVESNLVTEGYTSTSRAMQSLARLRVGAARAQALEAWQEGVLHALAQGLDYTPTADKAVGILKGVIAEVKETEQRLVTAESERDDARQEVETLRKNLADAQSDNAANADEARTLRERVATLEREKNKSADRLGCLFVEIVVLEELTWLLVAEGLARAESAERRVQELEKDLRIRTADHAAEQDMRLAAERREAETRHRVVALGAFIQHGRGCDPKACTCGLAEARDALDKSSTPPAPAPLVEAVGNVVKELKRARKNKPYRGVAHDVMLTGAELDAILAAHDAAKGGEDVATLQHLSRATAALERVGLPDLSAADFDAKADALSEKARKWDAAVESAKDREMFARWMRNAMGALYPDAANSWNGMSPKARAQWVTGMDAAFRLLGLETPPSGPGGGEPTHTSCSADDCGDDAPESCPHKPSAPLTPESLAAVVDAMEREVNTAGTALHALGSSVVTGARAVLRRVTGGQVPDVMLKSRVVEVLTLVVQRARAAAANAYEKGDPLKEALSNLYVGEANGATEAAELLGLTLPVEFMTSREARQVLDAHGVTQEDRAALLAKCMEMVAEAKERATATHHGGDEGQPREAQSTPTPEGPALAPVSGFTMPPPDVQEAIRVQIETAADEHQPWRLTFRDGVTLGADQNGAIVLPPETEWPSFFERLEETADGLVGHRLGVILLLKPKN